MDTQDKHHMKRTQILNTAKRRIQAYGYKTVTVDSICEDCGMSKKTFYRLFATKEDLLFALIDREFEQDMLYLEKQLEHIKNPIEQIKSFIELVVEFLQKDIFNIKFIMQAEDMGSQRIKERYNSYIDEKSITLATKYIENGRKLGYFKGVTDTRIYAYGIVKLFTSFTYLRTIPFDKGKEQRGYYTNILTNMIIQALSLNEDY